MITEQQYQRLMKEYQKSGRVKTAAMKAGMDRKTAWDYLRDKRGPKQRRKARPARTWRTRPNPLKELWPLAEPFLAVTPELEAKALFEHLLARPPQDERAEFNGAHAPPSEELPAEYSSTSAREKSQFTQPPSLLNAAGT